MQFYHLVFGIENEDLKKIVKLQWLFLVDLNPEYLHRWMSLNGKIDGTDWLLLSQISSHLRKECYIFISYFNDFFFCSLSSFLNSYRSCKIVNTELSTSFCQQRFDNFFMAQLELNQHSLKVCMLFIIFIQGWVGVRKRGQVF